MLSFACCNLSGRPPHLSGRYVGAQHGPEISLNPFSNGTYYSQWRGGYA